MTPDKLKEVMAALDFNTGDVAIITGNTRRAVQLWLSGVNPVPLSAALVLEAVLEGLLPLEWVEEKILLGMRAA